MSYLSSGRIWSGGCGLCDRDTEGKRENKWLFPHCLWETVVGDIDALLLNRSSGTDISSEWFPTHLFRVEPTLKEDSEELVS